jgi:hypothetical protein
LPWVRGSQEKFGRSSLSRKNLLCNRLTDDGQQPDGGGEDRFRIRIWDNNGGGLIYDNQFNAPDSDDPTTDLGGGSIVIHK